MRKSNKCEYKIGVNTRKKKRFLRPEDAIAEAEMVNKQPNVLKKFIPYKCTVCHFFHIGRSSEDNPVSIIFPHQEPEEIIKEMAKEDEILQAPLEEPKKEEEFDWTVKKEIPKEVVVKKEPVKNPHEDFDWDSKHKRIH